MLAMIIALVMSVSLSACSSEKSDSDVQSEFGTTVLYNADGTLKLYSSNAEAE